MNAFQRCSNTSDCVPLYLPQQLYLKPLARLNISLQLPNVKKLGKSVSHWEIMDKLRELIRPDEFTMLKVTKTTVEFVRFEAEVEKRSQLERVLSKIDNKMIKLKDFGDLMRVRAADYRSDFPNRRVWDAFFSEAKDMDEMKPGERPDTIHISNLPTKWFVPYHLSGDNEITPSEKIFYRVFEKFGNIRYVDIPICDPYRKKMKDHISGLKYSTFEKTDMFEGYVQFKDYIGFTKTMDALRDMKLVRKDDDGAMEVDIRVEFDKSKHLSDASIRRREIVRDRLVKKAKEKEERDKRELEEKKNKEDVERRREVDLKAQKEIRRRLREEKRKAKILKKLEISGSDEINEKIAREEKKLMRVQRKLEAIRLVEELFRRIKDKNQGNIQLYDGIPDPANKELRRLKDTSELEVLTQREKLHHAIKGRVMLKSILSEGTKTRNYSSSSSDSEISIPEEEAQRKPKFPVNNVHPAELMYEDAATWYNSYPFINDLYQYPPPALYHDPYVSMRGMYQPRGRGMVPRGMPGMPGPSRGGQYPRRSRGRFRGGGYRGNNRRHFPPELEEEYKRYFEKFLHEHDHREHSYSPEQRSSRRNRSRSRRRSYSRSRSRSRERRSRSRTYRSRSKSRRSYTRSRTRSRSKESRKGSSSKRKRSRSRTKTPPQRKNSGSAEKSSRRSRSKSKERREKSKERERSRSKERSRSRGKSVDSSKFMTPKQLQQQRERSRSWSMPKDGENEKGRSWSKSPEKG